ncbi:MULTISPECIES: SDR family NAD(P)-dependent oxidoreductase [Nocardiaceae]|uniref:NAD(P)-dependent dehydrogenase (Short-subunit alcohol dehydrogenase family) n=1 Tax=Rhodococcoides corynebacterioides TaxID=53972 RepID=A0ABS2KZM0_9NOCA|nr:MULTISPECIES: SDR family oxidoreductase [Rhodococcus]MBM7417383.1 NAD(P)-dependent dehydrogenase (short-subunit alcohol dehydrogenase family) [Rhodococcus corynebacterioides]MBP1115637.1 NAD(P)-dependent dehydrogenase (short-subunit alcohol dehydrogenase family) [Rhodococcus sp. PvP016]
MRLAGKSAVITGATSGLGLATLQAMTREGASVIAVGRDRERGQRAVDAVVADGGKALFHQGDVTVEADIRAMIDRCRSEFGRIDIMHNNAAYLVTAAIHETTNEQWSASLAANLTSVFWGTKHAVLAMREQGHGGSIVNTASVAGFTATGDTAGYVATKSGVLGLTRDTAIAYAAEGIRCNAVCPGDFDSPMLEHFFETATNPAAARDSMEQLYPTRRILSPADVAAVIVFLASEESRGMTGTSMVVDDGLTAKTY